MGKLLALAGVTAPIAILSVAAAAGASVVVAGAIGASSEAPSAGSVVGAVGAAWLILLAWAALGVLLAILFRGAGPALGLGLVYALVIEGAVAALPANTPVIQLLRKVLIGQNGEALAAALGQASIGGSALRAVAMLIGYTVLFSAAAAWRLSVAEVR